LEQRTSNNASSSSSSSSSVREDPSRSARKPIITLILLRRSVQVLTMIRFLHHRRLRHGYFHLFAQHEKSVGRDLIEEQWRPNLRRPWRRYLKSSPTDLCFPGTRVCMQRALGHLGPAGRIFKLLCVYTRVSTL
jgi:hypothetical protein